MSRIFRDTNLFVYLIEDRGERAERMAALRRWMIEREGELLTSTLTLGEILVKPMETGDEELMRRYEHAMRSERERRCCRSTTTRPADSRRYGETVRSGRRRRFSSPASRRSGWTCSEDHIR